VAVVVGIGALGSDDEDGGEPFAFSTTTTTSLSPEQEAVRAWDDAAGDALQPFVDAVLPYVSDTRAWAEGSLPTEQLRASLGGWADDVAGARTALAAVGPLAEAPLAPIGYDASAMLYAEAIRVSTAALDVPAGPDRDQVVLLAERLRVLGDRVFDRGRVAITLVLPAAETPDVDVNLPEEVPNWAAEQLAAEPSSSPPPSTPPQREDERPTQDRGAWLAAVDAAGAPTVDELRAAVDTGDATALVDLARRAEAAAEALRPEPDPATDGGREESARLRLGYLVRADAARAGQLAAVAAAPALRDVAAALLDVAAGPLFAVAA
jgi:hypothetical protein